MCLFWGRSLGDSGEVLSAFLTGSSRSEVGSSSLRFRGKGIDSVLR